MKKTLRKKVMSFVLVTILVLSFGMNVYAYTEEDIENLFRSYDILTTTYTLSGVVDTTSEKSGDIIIKLDAPMETPLFPNMIMKFAYLKGNWSNLSEGDRFQSDTKFIMVDYQMVDLTTSLGIFEPVDYVEPKPSEVTQEQPEVQPVAPQQVIKNTEDSIYIDGVEIDTRPIFIEGQDDITLLRLYVDNPGYMYVTMVKSEPTLNFEGEIVENYYPTYKIGTFNREKNTIVKNNTFYFPMKEVVEYYGYSVNWTPETGVTISDYLQITPNSNIVKNTRDGIDVILTNNIEIIDGTTYVPIEFLPKVFPESGFKFNFIKGINESILIDITQEVAG